MVVECEVKVWFTIVKGRMRSEEEMVGQYEVLGRICWKDCSETRGQGRLRDSAFSKSEWIIRASFKARSFLKYGEVRALGIVSTTVLQPSSPSPFYSPQRVLTVGQLETIKLELGKDKELVEFRLKLIYISRNGHKSNSKNSTLFFHSHNILAYFRRFSLRNQGLSPAEVYIAVNLCSDCICSLGYEVPGHGPPDINCRCYCLQRSQIPAVSLYSPPCLVCLHGSSLRSSLIDRIYGMKRKIAIQNTLVATRVREQLHRKDPAAVVHQLWTTPRNTQCWPLLRTNLNLINNPKNRENLMRRLIMKLPNVGNYNVKRTKPVLNMKFTLLRTLFTYCKPEATDTEDLVHQGYLTPFCPRTRWSRLREKGITRKKKSCQGLSASAMRTCKRLSGYFVIHECKGIINNEDTLVEDPTT
ncbi:hypothetical protein G5I_13500 [Acromyrmex echinatior]|uniref:Uncharacterized protein n=1 Tax=Acromyrmex echinatior TaxID=103372 RepID=F4X575_ACREC|nr:hypothetical protein G5I_13500 [Acromyrmex echinatior]